MKRKDNLSLSEDDLKYVDPEIRALAEQDPPLIPDPALQYIHHDVACVDCGKPWSQKWSRDIGKPYREMLRACETSLTGNGWARTLFGGWRCLACRQTRAARHKAQAPWAFRAGVVMGLAVGGYYILLGLGVVG